MSGVSDSESGDRERDIERHLDQIAQRTAELVAIEPGARSEKIAGLVQGAVIHAKTQRVRRGKGYFAEGLPRTPAVPSPSGWGTEGLAIVAPEYHAAQHDTWAVLCGLQEDLIRGKACADFLRGREVLEGLTKTIPDLATVHRTVAAATGWGIVKVDGYVQAPEFHEMVARRTFPCMDNLRPAEEIFYSPSPDMFHDLLGHVPAICTTGWGELYHFLGLVGRRATHPEQHLALQKIYVRAMEYGLIADESGERGVTAIGAALLTGLAELQVSWTDTVRRVPFTWDAVVDTPLDTYNPQDTLYVIPSLGWMHDGFADWARDEGIHP